MNMEKKPRIEVIRATVFNLKRDRDFWKRRAKANVENITQKIEKIINDPDRKTISITKLKKVMTSKKSGLHKFITIQVKLSDLFQVIDNIKDEAKLWRTTYNLDSRIKKIESKLLKEGES